MKKIAAFVLLLSLSLNFVQAQMNQPTHWKFEAQKINANEFNLVATASLDKGWYTYSQFIKNDGPIPTNFNFKLSAQYELIGKTEETSAHTKSGFDDIFNMDITKFSVEVKFTQRVKLKTPAAIIDGFVNYQNCDNDKCLPPQDEIFHYKINESTDAHKE